MARREHYQHRCVPVTYKGVVWPSLSALSLHYALAVDTIRRRLAKGQPLECRRLNSLTKTERI